MNAAAKTIRKQEELVNALTSRLVTCHISEAREVQQELFRQQDILKSMTHAEAK